MRLSPCDTGSFASDRMAIDRVQADLFFGFLTLVDFHLIFSVFGFRLILLKTRDWSRYFIATGLILPLHIRLPHRPRPS